MGGSRKFCQGCLDNVFKSQPRKVIGLLRPIASQVVSVPVFLSNPTAICDFPEGGSYSLPPPPPPPLDLPRYNQSVNIEMSSNLSETCETFLLLEYRYVIRKYLSYFSTKTYVVSTQKNHLNIRLRGGVKNGF